jgi:hypothetical protein
MRWVISASGTGGCPATDSTGIRIKATTLGSAPQQPVQLSEVAPLVRLMPVEPSALAVAVIAWDRAAGRSAMSGSAPAALAVRALDWARLETATALRRVTEERRAHEAGLERCHVRNVRLGSVAILPRSATSASRMYCIGLRVALCLMGAASAWSIQLTLGASPPSARNYAMRARSGFLPTVRPTDLRARGRRSRSCAATRGQGAPRGTTSDLPTDHFDRQALAVTAPEWLVEGYQCSRLSAPVSGRLEPSLTTR